MFHWFKSEHYFITLSQQKEVLPLSPLFQQQCSSTNRNTQTGSSLCFSIMFVEKTGCYLLDVISYQLLVCCFSLAHSVPFIFVLELLREALPCGIYGLLEYSLTGGLKGRNIHRCLHRGRVRASLVFTEPFQGPLAVGFAKQLPFLFLPICFSLL